MTEHDDFFSDPPEVVEPILNVAPKVDDRVQLISIGFVETEVCEGDIGTVVEVRLEGGSLVVAVEWDRGENVTLYNGQDRWRVLDVGGDD